MTHCNARYNCSLIDCGRILIDYNGAGTDADLQALPTARLFKLSAFGWDGRNAVGFFRSAWSLASEGAKGKHAYLAFKAANGVPNHNDLDGGTFVFEAGGQRWGIDMSSDNYGLPGYFTQSLKYRYSYYRKSTAGHNTLTFNNDGADWAGCDQDPGMSGRTEITLFKGSDTASTASTAGTYGAAGAAGARATADATAGTASPDGNYIRMRHHGDTAHVRTGDVKGGGEAAGAAHAPTDAAAVSNAPAYSIVDLTAAYGRQNASRVERGFAFTAAYEHLMIVDEFEFATGSHVTNVTWAMHTMADIKLHVDSGNGGTGAGAPTAVLSLNGAVLHATIVEPAGAVFSAAAVNLQPPFNPSVGVSKLMVSLHTGAVDAGTSQYARIVVGLSLSTARLPAVVNPLAQWKAAGPFPEQ